MARRNQSQVVTESTNNMKPNTTLRLIASVADPGFWKGVRRRPFNEGVQNEVSMGVECGEGCSFPKKFVEFYLEMVRSILKWHGWIVPLPKDPTTCRHLLNL